ncbi:MAG TPA: alpha/beta hydrolase [Casimicrobiaceae bacterium]|jgi:pimeloyl-ACP methyl ester carboxylesterase
MAFISVTGHRLEYERIDVGGHDRPVLVMLHEGLGSIAMWRDFPQRLAHATAGRVVVYSRYGYGSSDPLVEPRGIRYMHDEALLVLPALLDALGIVQPILVGHSDGASIALIHAGGSDRSIMGVVAMAPHVIVEDISVASIAAAREAYATTGLRARLSRYHADVDGAFRGWNDIWLRSDFRRWSIEEYLPRVHCPVLAIQGEDDEYGTMEQLEIIARNVPDCELVKLEDCRHSPHRDQPEAVLEAISRFVDRLSFVNRRDTDR